MARFAQRYYEHRRRLRFFATSEGGTSLPEVLVTLGMSGVILGLSVLSINDTFIDLNTAAHSLANDVRRARMSATTRGSHYRVVVGSGWYRTERLQDNDHDDLWELDQTTPTQQVELPNDISIAVSAEETPAMIEFDTRGMIVAAGGDTSPAMIAIDLTEANGVSNVGGDARIEVWPSGQVELLD